VSTEILNQKNISYVQAKELARHADPQVRQKLAAREDIKPEILYYLAEDSSAEVRKTVARNKSAPRQTDILLAKDNDAGVRGGLAAKIARVAPGLTADEQDKARRATYEALELLAKDQITKVRQILSEALKNVAHAPPEVIRTLATDSALEVCAPILEFSPVLTDQDLLEFIAATPTQGGLNAISKRGDVSESIADAIVGTNDVSAIADLLSNDNAQIREATLDDLINRAPDVKLWHAPLVGRHQLPKGAATRLAQFLADNMLDTLQARTDLDADTLSAVKAVVQKRIGDDDLDKIQIKEVDAAQDFLSVEPPINMVKRMYENNKLDTGVIVKALNSGDHSFVFAALVVRGGLESMVAKRIFLEKSAKGIMALAWKAKLPGKLATLLQQRMGRIAPSEVIKATGDAYPMKDDEMAWQIEFFNDLCSKGAV
jgi:uncharacterized protein (DUF2336 family)